MSGSQAPEGDQWPEGSRWPASDSDVVQSAPPVRRGARHRRRLTVSLAAAGITSGVVLGGVGLASAVSGGSAQAVAIGASSAAASTPSTGPTPTATAGSPRARGGWASALHGQFVVPKQGGGYETIDMQRGKVTAVSADSITVKSDDGYTKSYAVGPDTLVNSSRDGIGSIKSDAEVTVVASGGGEKPSALRITDLSTSRAFHERWGNLGGPGIPHPARGTGIGGRANAPA